MQSKQSEVFYSVYSKHHSELSIDSLRIETLILILILTFRPMKSPHMDHLSRMLSLWTVVTTLCLQRLVKRLRRTDKPAGNEIGDRGGDQRLISLLIVYNV